VLTAALAVGFASSTVQAANQAWSTNPTDANFSGINWNSGFTTAQAVPANAAASGDALFFDTSAITTLNNNLSGATFAGFTFNAGSSAFTIGGNAFTLSGALTNNGSSLQSFSNAITLQNPQTITGVGSFSLSGNLTGAGNLTKSGTGTLSLSGTTNAITGNLLLSAGRINVTAGTTNFAGAFSSLANTASTTARVGVSSGATFGLTGTSGGNVGGAATASGVIYNAGTFNQTSTAANNAGVYLGNAASSYGYLHNTGTATISGRMYVGRVDTAASAGSVGLLDIAGGSVTVSGTNTTVVNGHQGSFLLNTNNNSAATSRSSTGYAGVNVHGGTLSLGQAQTFQTNTGANLYTSVNVSGASSKIASTGAAGFNLNFTSNATNTTTFSLHNGGTLETSFISNTGTASKGILTFDGGVLKATAADATALIRSDVTTYIQSGGATINTNGFNTTIASALQAPAGNGISNITLGGTATGYVGAPIVQITGGGGTGAAAIANFDPDTGTVTGITITSMGSGYTSAPTITLVGGNGGSTGAGVGTITATATLGAVASGGLTKSGTGILTLSGVNTYTGATTISGGTLKLDAAGSINNTSGVHLGTSGTFDVSAKSGYTVSNLSGSGTVTGALTVSTQLAIGNSPGTVNFSGDLTLGSGSTYLYEMVGGGTSADLGDVAGALTLTGSILDLVQLGTFTEGDKFTLFAYDGALAGTFNGLADGATFTDAGGEWLIDYNDTTAGLNGGTSASNTYVTITAIPEPGAALLGGLGMLALLRRRRVA